MYVYQIHKHSHISGQMIKLRYLSFSANTICKVSIGITQSVPVHVPRPHNGRVASSVCYGNSLSEMALLLLIVAAPLG